jgi:signal transduction histidine kinase
VVHWQFTTSVWLYSLSGAVTLVSAWMAWQQREQRGVVSLAYAMLCVALWSFTGALEIAVVELAGKLFFMIIEYTLAVFIVLLMLFFVFEYHRLDGWLTPNRRRLLWVPGGLVVGLAMTNAWHKLIWTGFVPGPPDSNLLIYLHGPGYYLAVGYDFLLVTIAIGALMWQAFRSTGRNRRRAAAMAVSLAIPLAANLVYVLFPTLIVTVDLLPIGFALAGFCISVIVFQDMKSQLAERTMELQTSVQRLRDEIAGHQRTQDELRQIQNTLAQRVADQSRKLAALYEVILMGGQSGALGDILDQALARIVVALGSQAACLHRLPAPARTAEPEVGPGEPDESLLRLIAQHGLPAPKQAQLAELPAGWLLPTPARSPDGDPRPAGPGNDSVPCAVSNLAASPDVPAALRLSGYGAYLGTTIAWQGRPAGVLSAFWPEPRQSSVEEIALFSALADQLSVVIENARLRQLGEETAVLLERQRLGRDMHDSMTQSLHSLVLAADTAANRLRQGRLALLETSIAQLTAGARQALREMRLLLYELHPAVLAEGDLVQALRLRLEAVERRAGVMAELSVVEPRDWPQAWEADLYGIATEALNNALKHGRAGRVTVSLAGGPDRVELTVTDAGQGFDPRCTPAGGMGLRSMAERAARLGGQLAVDSAPGRGTTVRVTVGMTDGNG